MFHRADVSYRTDGSFDGLLCCVFESFSKKELPFQILVGDEQQLSLLPLREIDTDPEKASRVRRSIPKKMGSEAQLLIEQAFLHGELGRELAILEFMQLGYHYGARVTSMLDLAPVHRVFAMQRAVAQEAHLLTGFLRFSELGRSLVAVISPKNFVLPLLAPHFCERFCEEQFFVHDKTHGAALLYRPYEAQLVALDDFQPAAPGESELAFQAMWVDYYNAISISQRENLRCRMGHMPQRYWAHLTEMQPIPPTVPRRPRIGPPNHHHAEVISTPAP